MGLPRLRRGGRSGERGLDAAREPVGIECDGLSVVVGERTLVDDVHLSVEPGHWCTIAGPNGAGKTTLVRAVTGLLAHRGTVRIGGTAVDDLRPSARARLVALVPQQPEIPPAVTVIDYVLFGRTAHLPPLGAESAADVAAARRVISELDLEHLDGRRVASLSGGERQRAVVARALAQECPVLVLDEPTTGLDLGYQQDVLDLVASLRRRHGLTVLSTMHDLTLAGAYSDELVLMTGGRVVASGPVAQTLTEENLALVLRARFRLLEESGRTIVVPLPRADGR
ncbi:MAG: ABC transporter ATP-binding protein [Actinomycetota bacterium]|nr:ABC transporter ATP-binding protein [Actinomycetota bacterium]